MKRIKVKGIEVVIYVPTFDGEKFFNSKVIKDLGKFKQVSDVIVANRLSYEIREMQGKVYTRDLFDSDCVREKIFNIDNKRRLINNFFRW